ncbi:protein-disulfide isomerase [Hamadaea flava]|uniref:DsbA family protein n=1 Tax=Hamadaea flava TaxID=1742688 RepID=A0ABV8M2U4_9ACTN|nr:DsbA family protein [Hamadaea flava]MCP2326907.1 protein-disulfide isomerase [Hamadaea flava]
MSKRVQEKREAARIVREQLAREQRRKRTLWITIGVVAVLVIGGMIGYAIYASQKPTSFNTPAHANAEGTAIVTGSGKVSVDVYQDYLCPYCKQLHDSAGPTLAALAEQNKITLNIHPIAILDQSSTNQYSTRSAAASGCAADGGKFLAFNDALYANQPAEGGAGPTNEELITTGQGVGLTDTSFASCVTGGTYMTWPQHTTDAASENGVSGTPTVFVNGKKVTASLDSITAAITAAGGDASVAPTPSAS